jgi:trk system potassium uptake protein TrkH
MAFTQGRFNKKIFFYITGSNILLLGIIFLLSGIVSFYYGEKDCLFFVLSFLISLLVGGFAVWKNRNFVAQISKKDGRLIVGLMWLIIPILGALPYMFDSKDFSLVDALFESFSGYTTTGASVLSNIESVSKGVLFYRALTQWIGGLGFALLVIIFIKDFPEGAKNLFNAEFNSIEKEKDRPHIRNTVFKLFGLYFFFTISCFVLLNIGEMNVFEAICYTFSTISTGGFAVSDSNVGIYSTYSHIVIMVFMFLSGISFFQLISLLNGKFKKVFKDEQLRMYFLLVLFFSFAFLLYNTFTQEGEFQNRLKTSFFYVISTLSTTGFDLKSANIGLFSSACLI